VPGGVWPGWSTIVRGTTSVTIVVLGVPGVLPVPPAATVVADHCGWFAASTAMIPSVADRLSPVAITRPAGAGWKRRFLVIVAAVSPGRRRRSSSAIPGARVHPARGSPRAAGIVAPG
jgi:hypothetical protein